MARKIADCRDIPNEISCTLTISGEEKEVIDAAVLHAVNAHGEEDTPQLREMIRGSLKDETIEKPEFQVA